MRMSRFVGWILLSGLLAACSSPAVPLATSPTANLAVEPAAVRPMGQLSITIRWPRQIQLIPYSTNRVAVSVADSQNREVAAASIDQPTGTSTSEAQVSVPAGDDLQVSVQAYQDLLTVAEGQATASVKVNERTSLAIHLTPLFAPTVETFAPNGGVGAAIALTGTQFGTSRNVPIQVTFGGVAAPSVYRQDDGHLLAVVPSGVASGSIVVTADGVPSAATGTFWVLQELSALDQSSYTLATGGTLALSVTASTSVGAVADPYVEWSLDPVPTDLPSSMASGSFSAATGSATVFTASGTGSATLRVKSGSLQSTASVTIQ